MTNFDFLTSDTRFSTFSDVAISAEQLLHIDASASVLNCRRAMEFAIKWMFSVEPELDTTYDATLLTMMEDETFQNIVGAPLFRQMEFIRKLGNDAAHEAEKISVEQGEVCLKNLFCFLDFVASRYSKNYTKNQFNRELLELTTEEALSFVTETTMNLDC